MRIGYIGLGAMGSALARRLLPTHPTQVWDLNPNAVARLVALGATAAPTTKDLGTACEVIFLCLPRSSDVEQVIFGSGGLAEGMAPGTLIIDQTSGVPSASGAIASRLASQGIGFLDAPVAGGVPAAIAGMVTIMVSGPDDCLSRAMPLFEAISPRVYRLSDRVGDAQATKLVNNCINSGYRIATLELVAAGRVLGLSLPVMTEVLDKGWGSNFTVKRLLPSLIAQLPSTNFALSLMLKDVNQCLALGLASGVPMPISMLVRALMQTGLNLLSPQAGLDEIVSVIERLAAVSILDSGAQDADFAPEDVLLQGRIGLCGANRLSAEVLAAIQEIPDIDILTTDDFLGTELPSLIMDFTRRGPDDFRQLASSLALRGVSLIDVAPLSGQCDSLEKPVAWLCGGAKGAVERVRSLIEPISSTVIHCGPPGSARLAELVSTAAAVCNRAIVYENAHTGLEFGLEPGAMAVALNEGSGWSAEGAVVLKSLSTPATTTRVTLRAMLEEMNELIGLASAKNAPLFIPGMVRTLVEAELARFGPGATLDALARPPGQV